MHCKGYKVKRIPTCHSIINLMDVDNTGMIELQEFKVFWEKMKNWIMLFLAFDTDRSGKMSSYELRSALKAAGESPDCCRRFGLKDFKTVLSCGLCRAGVFQAMDKFKRGRKMTDLVFYIIGKTHSDFSLIPLF
uniref:EF-hand domain-containing protein n=1 Tax=Oryzias latipes TaxID=8090 RepID=A0A3P9MNP5_ORYLA